MDSEKIKELSEAYAEYMCPVGDYCGGVYDDQRNTDLPIYKDDAKSVLTWLSERYCIVEKSKVKEEYTEASNTYWQKYSEESQMDSRRDVYERGYNVGIMNVIEDIFGKDMFEEGEMNRCDQCRKWGTMDCPNSNECYALEDKPFFESRPQTIFDTLGKDFDRIVELFGEIKRRAKSQTRKVKSYVSLYAKFDKYHKKKRK